MLELKCPTCRNIIASSNINVSSDLAQCTYCNSIHKASELIDVREEKSLSNPPAGSSIQFKEGVGENFQLFLPPKRFQFQYIFYLIFCTVWLSFISFWTWGAFQASFFFALFSIPFWFIGLSMLYGIANTFLETQEIRLQGNRLMLSKNRFLFPKHYEFDFEEIQNVEMSIVKPGPFGASTYLYLSKGNFAYRYGFNVPTIVTGSGSKHFFELANEAEQEWISAYMDLKRKKLVSR